MKTSLSIAAAAFIAGAFLAATEAGAQTTSLNSGSLGSTGDGANTANVMLNLPGPLAAPGGFAVGYAAGARTTVPYNPALNPVASTPFTIEFWAFPTASDNDDSPLANRIASGNRSGWAFFQRDAATGWNFRIYDGNGSALGWDLTGGTSTLNAWSHVVATWNGSAAELYVNGSLADDTNTDGLSGIYNVSTSAIFSVGALFDGGSPSTGSMDEVAFYAAALTPTQIANHFATAASPTPGVYSSLVIDDGAVVYLQNNPEPSGMLAGDIDLDGHVTRHDAALFAGFWGMASNSVWNTGDFNGDRATTLVDLALLQANFGQSNMVPSSTAAVPEPSQAVMAFGILVMLIWKSQARRRRTTAC